MTTKTPDRGAAERLGRVLLKNEPNWITGDLGNCEDDAVKSPLPTVAMYAARMVDEVQASKITRERRPVQQSDLLEPLLMDIAKEGLNFAFQKWIKGVADPEKHSKTEKQKKVTVVGAGMAGLVAAFELAQIGHDVRVLESQTRLGGRKHTLGDKDGFAKGLHAEAGAIRLPCHPDAMEKTHFLADFYTYKARFNLPLTHFSNSSENAFLKFLNEDVLRIEEQYYARTTKVITDQLLGWLDDDSVTPSDSWDLWIDLWSHFSLDGFLQSTYEAVMTKVKKKVLEREVLVKKHGISLTCLEELKKSGTHPLETPNRTQDFYKAMEDIFTGPATKLFIQIKTRFWEKDGIKGGFSKTNLPIGQLHYPGSVTGEHPGEKGILLVYTWKTEALLFGSLDATTALHEAVEQIATIHTEIKEQVETGDVCAWYNQPTAQGAYALLKPTQYQNVRYLNALWLTSSLLGKTSRLLRDGFRGPWSLVYEQLISFTFATRADGTRIEMSSLNAFTR
ncbi:L-amino-acid oxidase [Stylophora pistillata]|uniref:L-amino-acid oxidase n=1 Tax=Stylophora pistillata TaxID=50429 RepID=A0A2B4S7V2_STYPI|nr:L-amino-acid oxidase [Stylophora pistillata]